MTDLFTTDQTDQAQIESAALANLLEKYKDHDPEALKKKAAHADLTISHLEKSLDQLREDYTKLDAVYKAGPKVEEIVEQLQAKLTSSNNTPANEDHDTKPAIDLNQIESLVSQKLQQHELTKRQGENFQFVEGKLIEHFGEGYKGVLKQQVASLGLTEEFVNDLAKNHPQVLLKTLGLEGTPNKENYQAPPRSNINSTTNTTPKKRTWSYWQEMRKSNPKGYYDPKNTVQRMNDAIELGDNFKDGDWSAYRT